MNNELIVQTSHGKVKGKISRDYENGEYLSFLGIPYGKPPIGELRFKAPEPALPWESVKDCRKYGPSCPSIHLVKQIEVGVEEDCLNLNVFTKSTKPTKLKPVMFFVHGGAFIFGSNDWYSFSADFLITEDVVLVSTNYRLGVFGFLCLENPELGVPGNAGLKDIVLALKWTKLNIEKFGGDPNNITIFGESAGAAAVHLLCLSQLSKGLFHKVIIQSGSALSFWVKGCRSNGKNIAAKLKFTGNLSDERDVFEYLKKVPAMEIVRNTSENLILLDASYEPEFGVVIESVVNSETFLSENPLDLVRNGRIANDVPMIIGFNNLEGSIFQVSRMRFKPFSKIITTAEDLEKDIPHDLMCERNSERSKALSLEIFEAYETKGSDLTKKSLYKYKSDMFIFNGMNDTIEGHKNVQKSPIYVYRFSLDTSLNLIRKFERMNTFLGTLLGGSIFVLSYILTYFTNIKLFAELGCRFMDWLGRKEPRIPGASHYDELFYLCINFCTPPYLSKSEKLSIKRMVKLWTNFAKTGNPNRASNINNNIDNDDSIVDFQWDPFGTNNGKFLQIGEGDDWRMENEFPEKTRYDFWKQIYSKYNT